MTSNRTAAGTALLAEIDAWCARTRTPETKIGAILFRHPGFVGLLRKRLVVKEQTEWDVRAFMSAYADGAANLVAPSMFLKPRLSADKAQRRLLAAVDGPSCRKCGRTDGRACGYPTCPRKAT